jgi:uncharacterized protein YbjT (DUF2867 family)
VRVAVIGATGTVGTPLVAALAVAHDVLAISRSGRTTGGERVQSIKADATDVNSMTRAVEGADVVYHLVHSLGQRDFEATDRAAARAVAAAAAASNARQIVYLGGLGENSSELSPHLRSRAETAELLRRGTVPVTTMRAAMIVGKGSAAFATILALVDRLPLMVCPRWVSVETQPVALTDVVAALLAVCAREESLDASYDLGGPEVMTYRSMIERMGMIRGRHPLLVEVPLLTPWLSSLWLHLVTPVHAGIARPLIEGLRTPTLAHDDRIWELVPSPRSSFEEAVNSTLARTKQAQKT